MEIVGYRGLRKDEIIQAGDEIDSCVDPWKDDPRWVPVSEKSIGQRAPDPQYPSHRQYRRKISHEESR